MGGAAGFPFELRLVMERASKIRKDDKGMGYSRPNLQAEELNSNFSGNESDAPQSDHRRTREGILLIRLKSSLNNRNKAILTKKFVSDVIMAAMVAETYSLISKIEKGKEAKRKSIGCG